MIDTALEAAAKIRDLSAEAGKRFVGRDDAIRVMAYGLVSGEHAILLGPPGTAKSALVRFFTNSLGLKFFRKVLNPDTTREDMVGPIDPIALQQGVWTRNWSGLATSEIVFADEAGKASNQVLNMMLDAMEERLVTSSDRDLPIPLHMLVAASNEVLDDEAAAIFDRFALRHVVRYIPDSRGMASLLTSSHSDLPEGSHKLERSDLNCMRRACKELAERANDIVIAAVIKMWSQLPNVQDERVSDRRWKKMLVVAAANALLDGRTDIEVSDLSVGKFMLWMNPNNILPVEQLVTEVAEQHLAVVRTFKKVLAELRLEGSRAHNVEASARVSYKIEKAMREINNAAKNGPASAGSHFSELIQDLLDLKRQILDSNI